MPRSDQIGLCEKKEFWKKMSNNPDCPHAVRVFECDLDENASGQCMWPVGDYRECRLLRYEKTEEIVDMAE